MYMCDKQWGHSGAVVEDLVSALQTYMYWCKLKTSDQTQGRCAVGAEAQLPSDEVQITTAEGAIQQE